MLIGYLPIFFELSKGEENAGLSSKFAKDWDVWIVCWFEVKGSSLKKSNLLFGVDIFIAGVLLLLGICKNIHLC